MGDVEVFYAELNSTASALQTATANLLTEAAGLVGEDTGIENPAHRASLRLEVHRRMQGLHDAAYARIEAGSGVAAALTAIADRYSELDAELGGDQLP